MAWICHDCLVDWVAAIASCEIREQQNELRFKLEFLGDMLCRHTQGCNNLEDEVKPLLEIRDKIVALDPRLDSIARDFLTNLS